MTPAQTFGGQAVSKKAIWLSIALGVVLGIFVILGSSLLTEDLNAQSCEDCYPGDVGNRRRTDRDNTYCFAGLTSTQQNAIKVGMQYWDDYFASLIVDANITIAPRFVESSAPCDIMITVVPSSSFTDPDALAKGNGDSDPTANNSIFFNSSKLSGLSTDELSMIAAHELGHLLGFADVSISGCGSQTVMMDPLTSGAPTTGSRCSDAWAGSSMYGWGSPNPSGGSDESKEETVGDNRCSAWYLVTRQYAWLPWAQEWFLVSESWTFLYVDEGSCLPLND